jgi:hypothetical protein
MLPLKAGRRSGRLRRPGPGAVAEDLYVTAQGLWVGGDTTRVGGVVHARIALPPC